MPGGSPYGKVLFAFQGICPFFPSYPLELTPFLQRLSHAHSISFMSHYVEWAASLLTQTKEQHFDPLENTHREVGPGLPPLGSHVLWAIKNT